MPRVYSCDASDYPKLQKLLEYDPYLDKNLTEAELAKIREDKEANIIFARQDYIVKDGASLSLDKNKYYLYLHATEDFLNLAEKKLKEAIPSIQRIDPETEKKIIETIDDERRRAEFGFGSIFGG